MYLYIYIYIHTSCFRAIRSIPHPSSHHRLWKVETEIVARFAKKRQALFGCSVYPCTASLEEACFGCVWMVATPICLPQLLRNPLNWSQFIPITAFQLRIGLPNCLLWGLYLLASISMDLSGSVFFWHLKTRRITGFWIDDWTTNLRNELL